MLKKIIYLTLIATVLSITAGVGILYWLVVLSPGDEIKPGNIEKILAVESPVYYRDGVNKIGVFFEEAHRQYLPFEEIPQDFVNSIIAAEDHAFYDHYGIDLPGVLRALTVNIKAGRVVQGGSTITQQTAKKSIQEE